MFPVLVLLEDTNTELTLWLNEQQIEKANRDSSYIQQLVSESATAANVNDEDDNDVKPFEGYGPSIDVENHVKPFEESGASNDVKNHVKPFEESGASNDVKNHVKPFEESGASNDVKNHVKPFEESGASNDESSSFIWSHPATEELLRLYEEYRSEFETGKKHMQVWARIAQELRRVNPEYCPSPVQCQTKMNGMKKTYRKILEQNENTGNITINWPYFDKVDEMFRSTDVLRSSTTVNKFDLTNIMPPMEEIEDADEAKDKSPKEKKTLISVFEKYLTELREERERRREEKQHFKLEKERMRQEQFQKLLELKEKQHKEKMQFLLDLSKAVTSLSVPDNSDYDDETGNFNDDSGDFDVNMSPNDDKYMWSRDAVTQLLDFYEEFKKDFESGRRHKPLWAAIAQKMQSIDERYCASGAQCQTKLMGLKKQYRKIVEQAEATGSIQNNWPYFEKMNELFGKLEWLENPDRIETKPKKRKLENLFESFMSQYKKQKRARAEEKERMKTQSEKERRGNVQALLQLKKEQHREKMKLLQSLAKPQTRL